MTRNREFKPSFNFATKPPVNESNNRCRSTRSDSDGMKPLLSYISGVLSPPVLSFLFKLLTFFRNLDSETYQASITNEPIYRNLRRLFAQFMCHVHPLLYSRR